MKEGKGQEKWKDGRTYEGYYHNDIFNGTGTYSWANGRKYSGHWVDSKFEGNIADMGGAIAVSGTSDLQIDSAYFDSNEASTGSCISCCPQETTCSTNVSEGDITYDGNVNTSSTGTNVDCQNISYSPPSI